MGPAIQAAQARAWHHRRGAALHLVIDASGLKIFGEGEWQVRQHGRIKHRTWRKLHLGVDERTGEIADRIVRSPTTRSLERCSRRFPGVRINSRPTVGSNTARCTAKRCGAACD